MGQYTPGPWIVKPTVYGTEDGNVYPPDYTLITNGAALFVPREIAEANARLMAAAPELLESLKVIVAEMREQYEPSLEPCSDCDAEGKCWWCAIYVPACVAIAKAEAPPATPVSPSRSEDSERGDK